MTYPNIRETFYRVVCFSPSGIRYVEGPFDTLSWANHVAAREHERTQAATSLQVAYVVWGDVSE